MTPRFTIGDCAGGHRGDNREKNRDVLIVPRKSVCSTTQKFTLVPTCGFVSIVLQDMYSTLLIIKRIISLYNN